MSTDTRQAKIAYTPGPWTTDAVMSERPHDIMLDYQIEGAGHPVLVASVYADEKQERRQPGYISSEQADANARLMAAAPEMLAALKAAQTDLETVQREISGIAPEAISPALPLIRAAIAKAEGR